MAINAQLIGFVMLFNLRHVLALQIAIPSLDSAGLAVILIFHLGRCWEWSRLRLHIRNVERERDLRTTETNIEYAPGPFSRSSAKQRAA